jgi:glycine/D-amino acid oxidase-like deaminating enzyme
MRIDCDYVVIGGGFAGLHTACLLADAGFEVTVLERGHALMGGASRRNFARLHHGWHYPGSLLTAYECIATSFQFLDEFGDVLMRDHGARPITGWCALARESLTDRARWLEQAELMRARYADHLHAGGPRFGSPADFFRVLDPRRWQRYLDAQQVQVVARTLEPFIDLAALRRRVQRSVARRSRVRTRQRHEVRAATVTGEGISLDVCTPDGPVEYRAGRVLNATWVARHELDATLDATLDGLTHRLKLFLHVQLPARLRLVPSQLFVHGPFCTLTNLRDGTALVDYAPVSNCATAEGVVPSSWRALLAASATPSQARPFARAILAGASRYVPGLDDARTLRLYAGALSHDGPVDPYDPGSAMHARLGTGVSTVVPGWLSLDPGKLSWVPAHARDAVRMSLEG